MTKKNETCFVGVDISKNKLDVYRPDTKVFIQPNNTEEDAREFSTTLKRKRQRTSVVMEATGGDEKMLLHQLELSGIEAAVVNPRRVRDFAKGIGIDAKTDPIDAAVISRYGQVVQPTPVACKSDHEKKHRALVDRVVTSCSGRSTKRKTA